MSVNREVETRRDAREFPVDAEKRSRESAFPVSRASLSRGDLQRASGRGGGEQKEKKEHHAWARVSARHSFARRFRRSAA